MESNSTFIIATSTSLMEAEKVRNTLRRAVRIYNSYYNTRAYQYFLLENSSNDNLIREIENLNKEIKTLNLQHKLDLKIYTYNDVNFTFLYELENNEYSPNSFNSSKYSNIMTHLSIETELLLVDNYSSILGSYGGFYSQGMNLDDEKRANELFDYIEELESTDKEITDQLNKDEAFCEYLLYNSKMLERFRATGIKLNCMSEDVERITNVDLQRNHRL